jgi:DNA-binding response OmpR family regulator
MVPYKVFLFCADAAVVQIITSSLIECDYSVIHFPTGVGAVDIIRLEKPSLVILDIELPGINSLAIIRILRAEEIGVRIPIILMGLNVREEDVLIGLEAGADFCLREAFHPQVFLARVRSLLRRAEPGKVCYQ